MAFKKRKKKKKKEGKKINNRRVEDWTRHRFFIPFVLGLIGRLDSLSSMEDVSMETDPAPGPHLTWPRLPFRRRGLWKRPTPSLWEDVTVTVESALSPLFPPPTHSGTMADFSLYFCFFLQCWFHQVSPIPSSLAPPPPPPPPPPLFLYHSICFIYVCHSRQCYLVCC